MAIRHAHLQASIPLENKILKIQAFISLCCAWGDKGVKWAWGGVLGMVSFSGEVFADSTAPRAQEGSRGK